MAKSSIANIGLLRILKSLYWIWILYQANAVSTIEPFPWYAISWSWNSSSHTFPYSSHICGYWLWCLLDKNAWRCLWGRGKRLRTAVSPKAPIRCRAAFFFFRGSQHLKKKRAMQSFFSLLLLGNHQITCLKQNGFCCEVNSQICACYLNV